MYSNENKKIIYLLFIGQLFQVKKMRKRRKKKKRAPPITKKME